MKIDIEKLRFECNQTLSSLVNRGSEVCRSFEARSDSTYFCVNCGYSQYIHLCKLVVESENK